MTSVSVRPIAAGDEHAWRRLFRDYGVFYETHFEEHVLDHVWRQLHEESPRLHALVAEVGGDVVGIAHYRSHPDTFSVGRDWYLDDMYVDPSNRGHGVASRLKAGLPPRLDHLPIHSRVAKQLSANASLLIA